MSETGQDGKPAKGGKAVAISSHNDVVSFCNITHLRAGLGNEPKTKDSGFNRPHASCGDFPHDGSRKHMDEVQRGQNNKQPVVFL